MKITKIPGFGSYGAIIDDFDWQDPASYQELKEINLKSLVTVVRGGQDKFDHVARNLHHVLATRFSGSKWTMKYGKDWESKLTDTEQEILAATKLWPVGENYPGWMRVTGKKNDQGKPLGVFGETELHWHNDESGSASFSPLVVLYGMNNMTVSATCFVQTADWYERQSESFRSELDQLVAIYHWDNDKIQPGADQLNQKIIKSNMVPEDGGQLPLVINTPGGTRGVYFSSCISGFVGMSAEESRRLLDKLKKEIFVPQYQFDYWWEHNTGDFVLMDQAVTLHNRKIKPGMDLKSSLNERLAYRSTGDYAGMLDYQPFSQEPYMSQRNQAMSYLKDPDITRTIALGWRHHIDILRPLTPMERLKYVKSNVREQDRLQLIKELALIDKN